MNNGAYILNKKKTTYVLKKTIYILNKDKSVDINCSNKIIIQKMKMSTYTGQNVDDNYDTDAQRDWTWNIFPTVVNHGESGEEQEEGDYKFHNNGLQVSHVSVWFNGV